MDTRNAAAVMEALIRNGSAHRTPVMIWGAPGVGKSDLVRQVAERVKDVQPGRLIDDLRVVMLDPVDLRGIPSIVDGRTAWNAPTFLPREDEEPGILFLDELPQGAPMVQAAAMQLLLDRKIGEWHLPDGWVVLCAGNRVEDKAGANRVITPLLNRCLHLDVEVSAESWQAWAADAGVHADVRGFLGFRPALLWDFDPKRNERAFPTPRSWAKAGDAITGLPRELWGDVVEGLVGKGGAAEFLAYLECKADLPDLDALVTDVENRAERQRGKDLRGAALYAYALAIGAKAGEGAKALDAMAVLVGDLPSEFLVLALREIKKSVGAKFIKNAAIKALIDANRNLITALA